MDQAHSKNSGESDFSNQRTAIPFGKFESGSDDVFPCNESMVGREGARAKLIDFLINAGARKAILVTGRRGMGKTSFVQYCLHEYEEAHVERYWHSDFGRTILSLVWLFFVTLLISSSYVISSSLLQILIDNLDSNGGNRRLLWIPIALLSLCLSYPIGLAFNIFTSIPKALSKGSYNGIGLMATICLVAVFGWLNLHHKDIPFLASPSVDQKIIPALVTLCWLSVAIGATYFFGEALSVLSPSKRRTNSGYILITSGVTAVLTSYLNNQDTLLILVNTFLFFFYAAIFRWLNLYLKHKSTTKSGIACAIKKAKEWFFAVALLLLVLASALLFVYLHQAEKDSRQFFEYLPNPGLWLSCSFLWLACFIAKKNQIGNVPNEKRSVYPSSVLILKATFLILASIFALAPLFTKLSVKLGLAHTPSLPLNSLEQCQYILMLTIVVALLFWIEYEWIIRPCQLARRDRSLYSGDGRPGYFEDLEHNTHEFDGIETITEKSDRADTKEKIQHYIEATAEEKKRYRILEKLTFLYQFNHFHLSTIVSTINLGFEELDHRSVIHAMLIGIREQYYAKFVSLRSPCVAIQHIFGLLLAMLLVSALAEELFNVKTTNNSKADSENSSEETLTRFNRANRITKYIVDINELEKQQSDREITVSQPANKILAKKYCQRDANSGYNNLPKLPKLFCELGGFYAEKIIPILYFEIFTINIQTEETTKILKFLFDIHKPYYESNTQKRMSLCIYHLTLFAFVFYLFRRLNRSFWFIPYRLNLEKIDDLLDALTATTTTRKNNDLPIYARWITSLAGDFQTQEKNIAHSNLDPRVVELQFMSVLDEISHSRPIYFKALQSSHRSPTIEITFVFDELDKLATDVYSQQQKGNPDGNDSELHRLDLMKGLLSNLKRIITSSEARFIFLGGRLLHDDWLADGARRQRLLTSIFSDEIYLPSLLNDANIDWFRAKEGSKKNSVVGTYSLHTRIEEYFVWQYYLAQIRFENWVTRVWTPVIGLRASEAQPRGFIQGSYKNLKDIMEGNPLGSIPINYIETEQHMTSDREESRLEAFIHFLAYRSAGNPKRLNELLASFMMSADRAIADKTKRDEKFKCQDILFLPDHKVMRIQLIARVYQQLRKGFEEKIRGRDDKTIVALIYLTDFLFKFHDRAFSWENLELIDELVHMHRGHDLRSLIHELVEHYSDRYLHRIINGMYAYRFRSYFANEINYLSLQSDEEMAAFNFTLDEAQSLRDHLHRQLEPGDNRNQVDILSMLGELHEFYQEYDMARQYYRRFINARFPLVKEYVGEKVGRGNEEMAILQAIYTNTAAGREALKALKQWGPVTLRMFLKIVMTYELEHNYVDALMRYESAIKFAECMIQSFAVEDSVAPENSSLHPSNPAHILEYLGLLFEPLFAYAWLLEKNSYTSGNSHYVLDAGIKNYDRILTSVDSQWLGFIRAQWYKKTGALCFYKGLAKTNLEPQEKIEHKTCLFRARNYYAKSATQLSNYFRKGVKTEFSEDKDDKFATAILRNQYPVDYSLSIAECLGDLSEAILGGINPVELFASSDNNYNDSNDKSFKKTATTLLKQLDRYFFYGGQSQPDFTNILDYLADRTYDNQPKFEDLTSIQQLDLAINLSFASTFYLLRAGYVESAAREAMHTIEVIEQYMSWYWFDIIASKEKSHSRLIFRLIQTVMNKIDWYANYLPQLLRTVRFNTNDNSDESAENKKAEDYKIGGFIPSSALTSLCSIGASLAQFDTSAKINLGNEAEIEKIAGNLKKLKEVIEKWSPSSDDSRLSTINFDYFQDKLIQSLQRHRYPVLNQLNALKILVDASLTRYYLSKDENAIKNTRAWLQELYRINEKYNHPLHFTPMQSGYSFYLYWVVKIDPNNRIKHCLPNMREINLRAEASRLLSQSIDMCHMGRGYYEAIEKLYYLYDDFNDNQVHRNHAMQMAGAELTKKALEKLRIKSND